MALLNLLPKRGPAAFPKFCDALKETDQAHVVEFLYKPTIREKLYNSSNIISFPISQTRHSDLLAAPCPILNEVNHRSQNVSVKSYFCEENKQQRKDIENSYPPPKRLCIITNDKSRSPANTNSLCSESNRHSLTSINDYLCADHLDKLLLYSDISSIKTSNGNVSLKIILNNCINLFLMFSEQRS